MGSGEGELCSEHPAAAVFRGGRESAWLAKQVTVTAANSKIERILRVIRKST
jgi:hypothetical protein